MKKETWQYVLHIGAEPNERWIGVMPSCKAEVSHPFSVPRCSLLGRQHSLGRGARSGDSRHRRKGASATAHLCKTQPWF